MGIGPFVHPEVRIVDTSGFHSQLDPLKVPVFGKVLKRQALRLDLRGFSIDIEPFYRLPGPTAG
jgi:hypothetical protein